MLELFGCRYTNGGCTEHFFLGCAVRTLGYGSSVLFDKSWGGHDRFRPCDLASTITAAPLACRLTVLRGRTCMNYACHHILRHCSARPVP